jgi:hypothetical protein
LLPIEPHNEFLELCAVSTSGTLTEEEQKRLQEHLAVCPVCRETLRQYEAIVSQAVPAIAANEASESQEPAPSWSEEKAEKAFFKRLAQEPSEPDKVEKTRVNSITDPGLSRFSDEADWHHVWMLYAAGILLFVSLTFYAYWTGVHRGAGIATLPQSNGQTQPALEAQLSDAGHERQLARAQIEQREKTIVDLRRQLIQQSTQINELKAEQQRMENDLRAGDASRQDLAQQRTELAQKLAAAQSGSLALQQKVELLARESAQDTARADASDAKVNDINRLLHEREVALDEKDEMLAHDRDIRDLMGARDLYIAEVYDVARTGETQKPFGRVFYTRGKSLIFYAYDLDQQAAMKKANAFQAWGRRGPDRQQALNLGVFYQDNASKKRWILKCDDPRMLAQIDAVFVTVEPNGGSQKPSGKSLLFAYLRVDPNHP